MQRYEKLVVLLPCYSLEDFDVSRNDEDADQLLAAWAGLFHPVLIQASGETPTWDRANDPPVGIEKAVITIPDCSLAELSGGWLDDHNTEANLILRGFADLDELLARLHERWPDPFPAVDPALVEEFFALGYCYLQVELLTRQLRYMSNLDEIRFREELTKAAGAAVENDAETALAHLQQCYDLLTEAREYFYPVEAHLLDLTLVAPTTLGSGLDAELDAGRCNMMFPVDLWERIAQDYPETLAKMQENAERGTFSAAIGSRGEPPLPLMPADAVARSLADAAHTAAELLPDAPVVLGHRRYALACWLPGLAAQIGSKGVFHFALDDGIFPTGNQSKIRWQGLDDTEVAALARVPCDASRPSEFLHLAQTLGQAMDLDHASTAVFAHWPNGACRWYALLRRGCEHSPVLGSFLTLAEYFRTTQYVGAKTKYPPTKYRTPYLRQAVEAQQVDPVSRWDAYHRLHASLQSARSCLVMAAVAAQTWNDSMKALDATIDRLATALDRAVDSPAEMPALAESVDDVYRKSLALAAEHLVGKQPKEPNSETAPAVLLINPHSFARRTTFDNLPLESPAATSEIVKATGETDRGNGAVVDIPGMGFSVLQPGGTESRQSKPKRKRGLLASLFGASEDDDGLIAAELALRNEFFQVQIDEQSGGIQGVFPLPQGRNLFGQQLARRKPRPKSPGIEEDDPERHYTRMVAEKIRVVESTEFCGAIESKGRLLDHLGETAARFRQVVRVYRGDPLIRFHVELEPEKMPEGDPWANYYAFRLAWRDETADVFTCQGGGFKVPGDTTRIESPRLVHIRGAKHGISLCCGGLPYHRKIGVRRLDTILLTAGESRREFDLAIGYHLRYPVQAAWGTLTEPIAVPLSSVPSTTAGWLFHIDAQNVIAASWTPWLEDGRLVGVIAHLQETEGKRGQVRLRCCRPVKKAAQQDLLGNDMEELTVEDDAVVVPIRPHQFIRTAVRLF
ncbi:hypothetical protein JCM19992_30000 [Thermostilla marina]